MELGQKIKNDVLAIYKSTTECANACNISRNTLIKIYQNGIKGISENSLAAVAQALGYDFEELKKGNIRVIPEKYDKIALPAKTANNYLEEDLLEQFRKLSLKGQVKVLDYVNDLRAAYPSEV